LKQKIKKKNQNEFLKKLLKYKNTPVRILDKETRKGGQRHRCHKIQEAKASF
jgi:hypothetical protein